MNHFKQLQENYPMIYVNFDELTAFPNNKFDKYAFENQLFDKNEFYSTVLIHCADKFSKIIKEINFKHKLCIGKAENSPGRFYQTLVYVENDDILKKKIEYMKKQKEMIEFLKDDDPLKQVLIDSQRKLQNCVGDVVEEETIFNKLIDLIVEYNNNSLLFTVPLCNKATLDFGKACRWSIKHFDCDHNKRCDYCLCQVGFPCSHICCVGFKYKKTTSDKVLFYKYIYHNGFGSVIENIVEFINKCNGY